MEGYIIAYDFGTSSAKAILLDEQGQVIARSSAGYPTLYPAPGRAEQEPRAWWEALLHCTRKLLCHVPADRILALSVCSHEMCCLPVDEGGAPLRPAMIWADTRAGEQARQLENAVGAQMFYRRAGMRAAPNYTLPKILWLREHEPEAYQKARYFLNPKDYINFCLCGCIATDPEGAAYTHGTDLATGDWCGATFQSVGLDQRKLPMIYAAGTVLGRVSETAARQTGLSPHTKVVMGMGDGGAATLGTATLSPGDSYTSLGTSSWVCMVTGSLNMDPKRRISKIRYLGTLRDSGTMQAGGYSYRWLKDTFGPIKAKKGDIGYLELDRWAAMAPPGSNGLLFLPYLMGERAPYWDPDLCGAFLGLRAQTTRGDLCRSVMEGVCLHLKQILDIICQVNAVPLPAQMKLVGGGANSPLWRQIFADVYGVPVVTVKYPDDAGALGVGVIAGTAVGLYEDLAAICTMQPVTAACTPDPASQARYAQMEDIFVRAGEALVEPSHQLSKLKNL